MNITFFGTCANDHHHLFECLKTIVKQSLSADEIVIVDSGDKNIKEKIKKIIKNTNIKLVYYFKKLSRVKALNKAIFLSNSKYLIRFDTRTRFNEDYALNAFKILEDSNLRFIGGVADIVPENTSLKANICSGIMKRSYLFFYPRHRRKGYVGYGSSVYLGCFEASLLKETLYRDKINLVSEDSLLASDLKDKGSPPFITNELNISYVCRSSFKNIIKLFNNYGYCRANSFLLTGRVHSQKRYFFILLFLSLYFLITFKNLLLSISLLVFISILINFIGEIFYEGKKSFIFPFIASLLQFTWFAGLMKGLISYILKRNIKSNFLN